MTVIPERAAALDTVVLEPGAHPDVARGTGQQEFCAMELVAWLAGEPWSDHPACTSPVIGAFLRSLNDTWDDTTRQRLVPYVTRVIGTNTGPADDDTRAWMALDWLVRTYTPAWLRLAKLDDQAALLEGLAEFTTEMDVPSVKPTIQAVRKDAAAAWDAAGAAAWAAAGAAAWDAAGAAARAAAGAAAGAAAWAAAGAAAWDAARAAAGAAARAAAGAAAWDAARDAARAAAGAAARAAAGAAAWDAARDAARAAAWAALQPTVTELQESALRLLDSMVAVGADHG